ncbi:unnamed protein product [Allacma fusca]|uniref:Uncharacterized protein n=1 Tax=Allacma fusca TaxID=39272 RepID=A0A8J2PSW4_9HEXA|nr:unnamed protein product [Allacma fusca]
MIGNDRKSSDLSQLSSFRVSRFSHKSQHLLKGKPLYLILSLNSFTEFILKALEKPVTASMSMGLKFLIFSLVIMTGHCRPHHADLEPTDVCLFTCDFCFTTYASSHATSVSRGRLY